jgi:oxygen-independent coproporphyrinogen-3 oxidase
VDGAAMQERFGIRFHDYFAPELAALSGPAADGLVAIGGGGIDVTADGRLFVRNVCMAFDRYLPAHQSGRPVFSRTI